MVEVLPEERDVAEIREHRHSPLVVVELAGDLEARLERLLRGVDVALLGGQHAQPVQRLRARDERSIGRGGQRGLQRGTALSQVGVKLPEPTQRPGEAQRRQPVAAAEREGERGPKVVALGVEARRPDVLARPVELRLALFGDAGEVGRVAAVKVLVLAARVKVLDRALVDDLQHREASLVAAGVDDKAFVDE